MNSWISVSVGRLTLSHTHPHMYTRPKGRWACGGGQDILFCRYHVIRSYHIHITSRHPTSPYPTRTTFLFIITNDEHYYISPSNHPFRKRYYSPSIKNSYMRISELPKYVFMKVAIHFAQQHNQQQSLIYILFIRKKKYDSCWWVGGGRRRKNMALYS